MGVMGAKWASNCVIVSVFEGCGMIGGSKTGYRNKFCAISDGLLGRSRSFVRDSLSILKERVFRRRVFHALFEI